jgi:hypothetical protein
MDEAKATRTMHPSLRVLTERFHRQIQERSTRLFEQDPGFRDICEEYVACVETLARLDAEAASPEWQRNEYAALLRWLERELRRYLDEHQDCEES